jgi:hypothetical protein
MLHWLLLAGVALPAQPQSADYWHLIVFNSEGGTAVIDYPSASRCERAKRTIETENTKRVEAADTRARSSGAIITGYGILPIAYCVPA